MHLFQKETITDFTEFESFKPEVQKTEEIKKDTFFVFNPNKINDEQSEEELQGVIDMYKTSSPDSEHEKDMLQSILTLNDTTVEEVFTHRKNIYSIDGSRDISEIIKKINMSRFTRIPVWKENPENI